MERGRKRVTMITGLRDTATGFAQARVIHGHADQRPRAVGHGLLQDRSKQLLGIPRGPGIEKILTTPTALLAAIGPDDARESTTTETYQQAQGLALGTAEAAELGKDGLPGSDNFKKSSQEHGAPFMFHC